jgi:hypothetical protein
MTDTAHQFARRAFQQNKAAQAAFLASLGVDVTGMAYARKLSLFCDARAPVAQLFAQLQPAATPTLCLVPSGVADADATRGGLTVHMLPALDDADYQRLLWCCDFNFIREDAARAQAAARPFIWQAAEAGQAAAHMERYSAGLPAHAADTLRAASAAWNKAGERHAALAACLAGPVSRTLTLHATELAS